ncbi:hypothetical protein AKJ40_02225 [candidate division MSBL1 archaeon SCGC-AAA259M10]|uniref:Uncharacterized protein n=2 Tax=candidate division MSBL1 TaxID=215777 RepID=A0A133U6Y5_9EURY|nr:hypothetical protein AKJ61_01790 [candidate division MSBL1 archaeon SCGC-AAA259B11]KXA99909.1 hypothetical protein AKJ40_02225 [candidate division MSBL1 archaeon SCGC-AAA259M10]
MEIRLCLKDKCIETVAEEKYEELAKELLKGENEEKEKKLEFLKDFLENADFNELRSSGYDGGQEMEVVISNKGSGFSVRKIK